METPYYVNLCGACVRQEKINGRYYETDDIKGITLTFRFSSEELYDYHDQTDFFYLIYRFGDLIKDDHPNFFLREDLIEPYSRMSEEKALKVDKLYCIDKIWDEQGNFEIYVHRKDNSIKPVKR